MSNSKIYVGNLSYETENSDLEQLFNSYGNVSSTNVIKDRDTGRARGFAFVEMNSTQEASSAIEGLNETQFMGRSLVVNMAKTKERSNFR